jgi:hypothetical protein
MSHAVKRVSARDFHADPALAISMRIRQPAGPAPLRADWKTLAIARRQRDLAGSACGETQDATRASSKSCFVADTDIRVGATRPPWPGNWHEFLIDS